MIPKKENPQAKDHRPITLFNTMHKTITSVIDGQLKEHQVIHQYMQIDQRGCTTNSIECIDNLIIDKTTLEEAKDRKKTLSCTWTDVKKAFDSITTNAQHTNKDHQLYHKHNEEMVHHTRG